ncbi:MAG: hypothetical protein JKY94_16850 [Rhodobacteraceae bacterium]|nr:hypothetical protein [Paracoccaceae bacterium]
MDTKKLRQQVKRLDRLEGKEPPGPSAHWYMWAKQCSQARDAIRYECAQAGIVRCSDIAKLGTNQREYVYRAWVRRARGALLVTDTLQDRISARVRLSEVEIQGIADLIGPRVSPLKYNAMTRKLSCVPDILSRGLFERISLMGGRVSYCAAQDYPAELCELRRMLVTS